MVVGDSVVVVIGGFVVLVGCVVADSVVVGTVVAAGAVVVDSVCDVDEHASTSCEMRSGASHDDLRAMRREISSA